VSKNRFTGEKNVLASYDYLDYFVSRALNPKFKSKQKLLRNRDSTSHLISLFALATSIQAKSILELGVRRGITTMPLLYAASLFEGTLDSVDIKKTKFVPPKSLRKHWRYHKQDSIGFLKKLPQDRSYDFVFIDDWHAYEHVKEEISLLSEHVRQDSLITLHDLMLHTSPEYNEDIMPGDDELYDGGPYRAVSALNRDEWEFATIPIMNGLTILRKLKPTVAN